MEINNHWLELSRGGQAVYNIIIRHFRPMLEVGGLNPSSSIFLRSNSLISCWIIWPCADKYMQRDFVESQTLTFGGRGDLYFNCIMFCSSRQCWLPLKVIFTSCYLVLSCSWSKRQEQGLPLPRAFFNLRPCPSCYSKSEIFAKSEELFCSFKN